MAAAAAHPNRFFLVNKLKYTLYAYEPLVKIVRKKMKDIGATDPSTAHRAMYMHALKEDLKGCISKTGKMDMKCFDAKVDSYVESALKNLNRFIREENGHNAEGLLLSYAFLRGLQKILSLE